MRITLKIVNLGETQWIRITSDYSLLVYASLLTMCSFAAIILLIYVSATDSQSHRGVSEIIFQKFTFH